MTIIEKVKERIFDCPLGSPYKTLLRGILGELVRNGQEDEDYFVRQWIRNNRKQRRVCRRNAREAERIDLEIELLRSLLED